MRQLRQVGDADRAQARHHRMNAAIDHRDQRVEHVLRHAGAAGRHAGNPRHQHRAHGCAIVGGADADRTCKDCAPLVLGQICCAEPLPGVGAECGVDAVRTVDRHRPGAARRRAPPRFARTPAAPARSARAPRATATTSATDVGTSPPTLIDVNARCPWPSGNRGRRRAAPSSRRRPCSSFPRPSLRRAVH